MSNLRYLVTGASGQLGRLVVDDLLRHVPAAQVSVLVRKPEAAAALAALGVDVRTGSYDDPASLDAAFSGVDRLLLISSSEIGQREAQHRNVVDAAKRAGVGFLAYTSILRADVSPLGLAADHRATEAMVAASGIPHAFLRNGWYTENLAMAIPSALEHGATLGSAGDGRFSTAARADYAAAAVVVLLKGPSDTIVYELAGDEAFTLADFAATIGRLAGKPVVYNDMPEETYKATLIGFGLPEAFAGLLADSDAGAAKGALFDDGRTLSALIGRPTTPHATTVAAALGA